MMKTTILKLVVLTAVSFASCTKKPSACFTLNENKGSAKVNEEVKFDATCSTNAKSYTWDFGNTTSDAGVSVKTKYSIPGAYNVTLTTKNGSKSDVNVQTITITN
jgi:PKD repeat protein